MKLWNPKRKLFDQYAEQTMTQGVLLGGLGQCDGLSPGEDKEKPADQTQAMQNIKGKLEKGLVDYACASS